MSEIKFENGSQIKTVESKDSDKVIRGKCALMPMFDDSDIEMMQYLENEYD